ncbi:MAG: hypothetical protein INR65_10000 [Gluconacetobacter diazotrophicus]|nr:hypothetical protein [Gluconacetobacter diazotrophicus]
MRILAGLLLFAAILLAGARLFTGIVYESDAPIAHLVLKPRPAMWVEYPEHDRPPLGRYAVLDTEEPRLAYDWLYEDAVGTVPAVPGLMVVAAAGLLLHRRRRGRNARAA